MRVILNTGSTVYQGAMIKGGMTFTEGYVREAAYCDISPADFEALGRPWFVRVTNEYGDSVVLKARKSRAQQKGEIFIPRGVWANIVVTPETMGTGSPRYKNLPVEIEKCDGSVLDARTLMCQEYYKGKAERTWN